MFLTLVREPPSPARTPKNLLAGGTGKVHLHNKSTQGLEIPMAVSDAAERYGALLWARRTERTNSALRKQAKYGGVTQT